MELKTTVKLYNNLLNFLLNTTFEEDDIKNYEFINEQVYHNLESLFLKLASREQYFDYYLFENELLNDIYLKWAAKKTEVTQEEVSELLKTMKLIFQLNKDEHFILIPLPKLKLKKIISNKFISIIPREISESEKFDHLSNITGLTKDKIKESLEHTKKSRSPDFLLHAILVVHYVNQTDYIQRNASSIARGVVFLLRTYYYGNIYEVDEYLSDDIDIFNFYNYKPNHHLVILAKDNWRQGHSSISYSTTCNFSAEFLHEPKHMDNLLVLIEQLVLTKNTTESMQSLFYGALLTYNRSLDFIRERKLQSLSLGILLMITTAETILSHESYGNRMRVRVLLPRFVETPDILKRQDIVLSLEKLYKMRNEYAHAGKEAYINESKEELNYYNVIKKAVGKLICMYPKLLLEKEDSGWSDYLKRKFNAGIDGDL